MYIKLRQAARSGAYHGKHGTALHGSSKSHYQAWARTWQQCKGRPTNGPGIVTGARSPRMRKNWSVQRLRRCSRCRLGLVRSSWGRAGRGLCCMGAKGIAQGGQRYTAEATAGMVAIIYAVCTQLDDVEQQILVWDCLFVSVLGSVVEHRRLHKRGHSRPNAAGFQV